jgi:hypothetical protein
MNRETRLRAALRPAQPASEPKPGISPQPDFGSNANKQTINPSP